MLAKTTVSSGSPQSASTQPHSWRRGDSGVTNDRTAGRRRLLSSSSAGREITCTSIGPDMRTTRLMTEPLNNSCQRDRALAPSTIWVAFSDLANSTRAVAMSLPAILRYSPPSSSRRWRWAVMSAGA